MFYVLGILTIIAAIGMIAIVSIQNSKGGGINSTFGINATQVLGARRSNEFVEKLTWYLAVGIAVLAFATNIVGNMDSGPADDTLMIQRSLDGAPVQNATQAPDANQLPQAPATEKKEGAEKAVPAAKEAAPAADAKPADAPKQEVPAKPETPKTDANQ